MRLIGIASAVGNLCLKRTPKYVELRQLHCAINLCAGHSKWANIKHTKAEKDGQKAMLFTRISRQIRIAIQDGGSADPALNAQLRSVIDEGLRKNMPLASIQNSIKKFQQTPTQLKRFIMPLRYKQKVFVICVLYTENLAGLKMSAATVLRKHGAIQTEVSHLFDEIGFIQAKCDESLLKADSNLEERATDDAIECGAEDVEVADLAAGVFNFSCSPLVLNVLRNALEKKGYIIEHTEHIYMPKNTVQLTEEELKQYNIFVQKLREIQGVDDIYDNISAE